MKTIKPESSIDGWRSMILERNGQARDLALDFPSRDAVREFVDIIDRMDTAPRVETNRHKAMITFNSYRNEST